MVSLVLDASSAISWFMPDEQSAGRDSVLERVKDHGAVVPAIWHLEVANAFLFAQRRARITKPHCAAVLRAIADLPIEIDDESAIQAFGPTFALASQFRLSLYDATYLELAHRLRLPLATRDRALKAAATAIDLELLDES